MLDLDISKPFADLSNHVDAETDRQVSHFLYAEARVLDREAYQEWLDDYLDPGIHYWMPDMETRRRDDLRGAFAYGEAAYFDDTHAELAIRVRRYNEPSAWADNPATRHVHLIGNIEAFETGREGFVAACSVFTNVRNRNAADQDVIHGRREDVLRRVGGGFRLYRRRVFIVQNVLLSKNLNTFF